MADIVSTLKKGSDTIIPKYAYCATNDANGNAISSTYLKTADLNAKLTTDSDVGKRYFWWGQTSTAGGNVTTSGWFQYIRIAPKRGLISGSFHIWGNSVTSYRMFSLSWFGSKIGISFKNPSANYVTGCWYHSTSWSANNSPLNQLNSQRGVGMEVNTGGYINPGRYYNENSSSFGIWQESALKDSTISFYDIYVEEN